MVVKDVGSRIRRRGLMLVLSSPSGAGKSTIARNLLEKRSRLRTVGQRDDAAAARQRDRGRALPFRLAARVRQPARYRRAAGMGGGARQFLRHAARAGREGDGRRPRHAVRHRLAGRQAAEGEDARRHRLDLHPAALDEGIEGAAEAPRRGPGSGDRDAPEECPHRDRALDANTTTSSINDDLDRAFGEVARSSPASGCAATAARACSISSQGCSTRRRERILASPSLAGEGRQLTPHSPA